MAQDRWYTVLKTEHRKMVKVIKVAMALFAVVTVATGCKDRSQTSDAMLVDIVDVEGHANVRHTEYPGLAEAKDNTDLSFKVPGVIRKVLVKEGDHVTQGQVLVRLDSRDYETQLAATESEYRQVKAECERVMAMHAERAVSDNNYDKARSGLERITAKLKNHRDQLEDCVIRAPYAGYVSRVYRSDNEAAGPGIPVVGLFTSAGIEVVINVPETEYARRGQKATCQATFSALPGRVFPLRLTSVSQQANANQLFQMRLSLASDVREVTPGMSAMVSIDHEAAPGDNKTQIPVGALYNEKGQAYVFVYHPAKHTVHKTPVEVETLLTDGHAVIAQGITAGQQIVASGVGKLTDGQQVKPLAKASKENVGKLL